MANRTNPAGSTVAYSYDAAGRPIQITLPDGNTWQMTYDANGNMATQTDPLGHVVSLTYDANNNVTQRTFVPTGATTQHTYDAMNRLVMTTDALGGETTYVYDVEGRLGFRHGPRWRYHELPVRQERARHRSDRRRRWYHDLRLRCPREHRQREGSARKNLDIHVQRRKRGGAEHGPPWPLAQLHL